jgi:hypothetical protein
MLRLKRTIIQQSIRTGVRSELEFQVSTFSEKASGSSQNTVENDEVNKMGKIRPF